VFVEHAVGRQQPQDPVEGVGVDVGCRGQVVNWHRQVVDAVGDPEVGHGVQAPRWEAGSRQRPESLTRCRVRPIGSFWPALLDLEDAQSVMTGIDDPRSPREPDVGDPVLGLQAGQVVVLDRDSA
jgi:hypothetical protein